MKKSRGEEVSLPTAPRPSSAVGMANDRSWPNWELNSPVIHVQGSSPMCSKAGRDQTIRLISATDPERPIRCIGEPLIFHSVWCFLYLWLLFPNYFQGLLVSRVMYFMKSCWKELCVVALFIVVTFSVPQSTFGRDQDELLDSVDRIIEPYVKADWFTGTVALYQSNEVVYQRSHGFADIDSGQPITADTKIRIGSITKHYTAALILRLIQHGVFELDDPLAKFDLGFPPNIARKITVRHLLGHRSGFEDLFTEEYRNNYRSLKTIDDKLPLLMSKPLRFEPGTDRYYSNYGYIVLGAIVERTTGESFKQILEAEILEPIGALNTDYALTNEVKNKALSYSYTWTGRKVDVTNRLENLTPDGGMYASASDLVKFYSALYYSDKLINDRMKAIMMSGYMDTDRSWSEIVDSPESIRLSYGGGPGVSAAVELHLRDRFFVVVLANTDALVAEKISQRITDAFRGNEPKAIQLPMSVFANNFLTERGDAAFLSGIESALRAEGYEGLSDRPLNKLGFELLDLGEQDRAITVFEANCAMFPDRANTFDSLAYAYAEMGNTDLAVKYYKEALRVDPSFKSAKDGLKKLTDEN
jgi:CubicO group peptidase (beta-lactamase class C family)